MPNDNPNAIDRFQFSQTFRDAMSHIVASRILDATEVLVLGINGTSEEEIMEYAVLCAFNSRHDAVGWDRYSKLCRFNDKLFVERRDKAALAKLHATFAC